MCVVGLCVNSEMVKFPTLLFSDITLDQLYEDETRAKLIEKASMSLSVRDFQTKTKPSLLFATNVGNAYTASVFAGLASLLARYIENIEYCSSN